MEAQTKAHYFDVLYPIQDQVLQLITQLDTGFPADLARLLCTVMHADWEIIRWIEAPPPEQFMQELRALGENLIIGEAIRD